MKKVKVFLLLIINAVFCFAQNTKDLLLNVIPPSPTVSALCKYAQYPVDYSTGVTNMSIPIYTIKCGSLELPISLAYHASGIKVDDMASWVGLGWSLNYGGCIGRTVYGNADRPDSYPYYIPKFEDAAAFNPINANDNFNADKRTNAYYLAALDDIVKSRDGQPDVFSYNFCGNTGQFMYDYSENRFYDIRDNKNVTITPSFFWDYFTAYDSNGNYYEFKEKEAFNSNISSSFHHYVSAWHITEIKSYNQSDYIKFDYYKNTGECDNYKSATSLIYGIDGKDEWRSAYWYGGSALWQIGSKDKEVMRYNGYLTPKIKNIKCSNGLEITFLLDSDRKDTNEGDKLNEIIVRDTDGKVLKRFVLEYEYFKSYITCEYDSHLDYRLKLKSVKEYGSDNTLGDVYSLDYYGENSGEPQMPYRHSYCGRDKWGYCNALVNSADAKNYKKAFPIVDSVYFNMYKQLYGQSKICRDVYASYTDGSNMDSNQKYAVAYMLKKIRYSTGASIEFKYELNHYSCPEFFNYPPFSIKMIEGKCEEYGAGLRIKEIVKSDGNNSYTTSYTYSEGEIVEVPHFVARKHFRTSYLSQNRFGRAVHFDNNENISSSISEQEMYYSHNYNGESQTYLEIYPTPYNIERLGNGGIGYTEVIEKQGKTTTEYSYSSINNEQSDNSEYSTFSTYRNFISMLSYDTDYAEHFAFLGYPDYLREYGEGYTFEDDQFETYPGLYGTYFSRGLLLSKTVMEDSMVKETLYNVYRSKILHRIPGIIVELVPGCIRDLSFLSGMINEYTYNPVYKASLYYHIAGRAELAKTIHRKNGVSTTTSYTYNSNNQVVSTTTTDSYNRTVVNTIKYASDLSDSVSIAMQKRNMLDYPVECTELVNGKVVSANLTTYRRYGGTYYPYAVYKYSPNKPDSTFVPYSGNVQKCYGNPLINYTSYCNGRLCEAVKPSGLKYTYLWSYKWEYPVAEIMSNTVFNVGNYINNESLGSKTFVNESMFADLINACKNNNWQIVRYTYKPFIGIETITPLSGATLKYSYDGLGRLTGTYENGNLTESYDYHIKK